MTVLDLDDETTWPGDLLSVLGERFDVLRAYEQHEQDVIDRRIAGDRTMSYAPPANPHETARRDTLRETDARLKDRSLIGYHCTRLHHDEIESIHRDGLRPGH